ncbi:hypothetical protein L1987_72710 [Smallanthus sonchifolius]|uniref:Uncharacterized protein n=1 Tax=Smallanthus sonchifolius TaxID=185202 RepID=A0ACB9AWV7_9ASTR|nr:hypothetical protein L1987_72710 [Smallanthus sonchifolius]
MRHFKFVLFCFFFAGILFSRSTASRPIHVSVKTELESKGLAPDSPSLAPAESPLGSEQDGRDEQTVHTEKHRHSSDESVAGGGVIIGGLVTITFAAIYCYIRVTRKRDDRH